LGDISTCPRVQVIHLANLAPGLNTSLPNCRDKPPCLKVKIMHQRQSACAFHILQSEIRHDKDSQGTKRYRKQPKLDWKFSHITRLSKEGFIGYDVSENLYSLF
jgi:hypothetical protein